LKAFPAPTISPGNKGKSTITPPNSTQRNEAVTGFILSILSLPLLPNRIPLASLTALAGMPIESILLRANSSPFDSTLQTIDSKTAVHLLANILAFTGKRVATFSSSKVLCAYLRVLQILLDRLPVSILAQRAETNSSKGKPKEIETIVIQDSDDEEEVKISAVPRSQFPTNSDPSPASSQILPEMEIDSIEKPSQQFSLDPKTLTFISTIASRDHLLALLQLSSRYSSSSRPFLTAFLVSLLATWPAKRDDVISTVVYGPSSQTGSIAGERGGGLLRELYRGYVRTGALGKLLAKANERDHRGGLIIQTLSDKSLSLDWTVLILLSELYTRCLLTLGDDEFYSERNPLSLDEVVGLSGLLRNLAFQLYWQQGEISVSTSEQQTVAGTRIGIEQLRTLATNLLVQIHARDSRKPFTPQDHWLMTSQFDLASFIQTVVYEDQKLDADDTEETQAGGDVAMETVQDENFASRRRLFNSSKNNLTKRQMAFISPRLGILNNIPFVIPFETRVAIFRQFVANDRTRLGIDRFQFDRRKRHRAIVRRNHLAEDAFAHLNGLGSGLKSSIEIVFIDEHGLEESGIDGGGLFKELLTSLSKEIFDTDRGLWLETEQREIYPNPHSYAREAYQLNYYSFIGRILGKALYEGILIDVRFAAFFLAKWLGRQSYRKSTFALFFSAEESD